MFKVIKSDSAFGCTSNSFCFRDTLEEAEEVYNKFVINCNQKHKEGSVHKYTVSILKTETEDIIKTEVFEPVEK